MSDNTDIMPPATPWAIDGTTVARFVRDLETVVVSDVPGGKMLTVRQAGVETRVQLSQGAAAHVAGLLAREAA